MSPPTQTITTTQNYEFEKKCLHPPPPPPPPPPAPPTIRKVRVTSYPYFKEIYKLIVIDLSQQQLLYVDPKAKLKINFAGNLERDKETKMCFPLEEVKETIPDFLQGTVKAF